MIDELQRESTDEELAQAKARFGADWRRIEQTLDRASLVSDSRDSGARRYIRLVEIADQFSNIIAPYAACQGKGCSHCCKQAVNITEREAIRIGEHLGRAPARLPVENDPYKIIEKMEADVARYTAQPCPMLAADGSCTVYEVRPLACRLSHSLEPTPDPCNLETGRQWVRKLTTHQVSVVAVAMDINRSIGDIRDYFP